MASADGIDRFVLIAFFRVGHVMTFHLQIIVCNARVIDGGYTQRVNIGAGAAVCSPVHTARIGKAKRSLVKPAAGITCRNCDNHAAANDFIKNMTVFLFRILGVAREASAQGEVRCVRAQHHGVFNRDHVV